MADERDVARNELREDNEPPSVSWDEVLELERKMVQGFFVALNIMPECLTMLEAIREYLYEENPQKFATLGRAIETIIRNIHEQLGVDKPLADF